MTAGERIIMLIAAADRRAEPFSKGSGSWNGIGKNDACTVQNNREFGFRQNFRRLPDGIASAGRALQAHDLWQFDVDHLGPVVAWHIDLRGAGAAPGLFDHPVENFCNA